MNLFNYLKENVDIRKLESLENDNLDIGVVRYAIKEISKKFYRDYTFFFDKENLKDRKDIYDKKFDLNNVKNFNIVCKSYCDIIQEALKKQYDIDCELISPFDDYFKHVDLLIKTKNGKQYIIDPLSDLIEMQVGMRTNNFASKTYYDNMYKDIIEKVDFLDDKELEKIDNIIGYKNNGVYLDDFLEIVRKKLENIEELVTNNKKVYKDLIGEEPEEDKYKNIDEVDLKLKFIGKYLNNRKYLNGTVDLLMFLNIVISKTLSEEEEKQIEIKSFFVDNKDLRNRDLKKLLENSEDRKRGIVINYKNRNYIFSLNSNSLEFDDNRWNEIIKENKIFIKPNYNIKLMSFLKKNNVNRNIIHNNEFLRLFSEFEKKLLDNKESIESIIQENIIIENDMVFTKDGNSSIVYKIEDTNLVIKDYKNNTKRTVFYEDEGRKISYKIEANLNSNEKVNLNEFDSNGLIDLESSYDIDFLLEPLSNGKYLSRNKEYYKSKTYLELAKQREKYTNLLTEDVSKRNFVLLEYLSNSSAKIFFEELKKKVNNEENHVDIAEKCFEEDCSNIVRFFNNEPILKPKYKLPQSNDKVLERYIEMDNKQQLYLFCSNLKFSKKKHVLTPGLGSIYVGPILKKMYGFDYTNILFSLYSKDKKLRSISEEKSFNEICSNDLWEKTKNELLLIDDNVGSCTTMNTIRKNLLANGKTCKFGAIKYNWEFYNKVINEELNHPKYDVSEVDFLTIFDDPGYWIMRDSIEALKELDGDAYVNVMKEYGLRQKKYLDIQILMNLAEKYSENSGIDLYDMRSKDIKKSSAFLCTNLKKQIEIISKEENTRSEEEL